MSTSVNNYLDIHYMQSAPSGLIGDLRQKAFVDKTNAEMYGVRIWVNSVIGHYQQGDLAILNNNLESAYISYMRGCSIMVEIIKFHSCYDQVRQDPVFLSLKKRTNEQMLFLLKDLALRIEAWYMLSRQQTQLQQTQLQQTYYTNPYMSVNWTSPVTTQIASYAYIPSHDPRNFPHYSLNDVPVSVTQIPHTSMNRLVNRTLPDNNGTNNQFSNMPTIEPIELTTLMTAEASILLIDVRPREAFKNGYIKHPWIIQIEPVVLQYDVTTMKIQASLVQNPKAEQTLFEERARFDLIVYYDQNSTTIETAYKPAFNMRRALESEQIKRLPRMLTGGFEAWMSTVGEIGICRFPVQTETKPWLRSSSDSAPHEPQDNGGQISKPRPLPTAPRKESQTTRYPELLATNESPFSQQQQQQPKELRPIPPSYSKLHRQRTFIDNSFHVTTTASNLYDVPPMAGHCKENKQIQTRPSSSLAELHRVATTTNIHAIASPTTEVNSTKPTGLVNLGNTCYLNSIVQCLSGTTLLVGYLTMGAFKKDVNKANRKGSGGELVESFACLVKSMWSADSDVLSPSLFKKVVEKVAPQFSNNDQHDSQEFLIFLLDGLHEDLNEKSNSGKTTCTQDDAQFEKLPDWQASSISWDNYLNTNASIIVSLFQGQYRSRLTCHTCKHTSTTYNTFMTLSLPVPAKKMRITSVTLNQCLDYFVKEEILDKEDAWRCPKCQKKRKATKQLTLSQLPTVLLIHLKRFSVQEFHGNKLDTMVKCPTRNLDLSGYVPMTMTRYPQDRPSFIYDLYAVSNHSGSLSDGHYTASVRDGYDNDKWHSFDDKRLKIMDETKVVTKEAYNLFYVRSKVK